MKTKIWFTFSVVAFFATEATFVLSPKFEGKSAIAALVGAVIGSSIYLAFMQLRNERRAK